MSESMGQTGPLLTMSMAAFLRLVDAVIALQAGLPVENLRPRTLADLDEEARRYVEQILAARGRTGTCTGEDGNSHRGCGAA